MKCKPKRGAGVLDGEYSEGGVVNGGVPFETLSVQVFVLMCVWV